MFSLDLETVYLFHETGVYEPALDDHYSLIWEACEASPSQMVWVLFDDGPPPMWLWEGCAFLAQTTPPDYPRYRKWTTVHHIPYWLCSEGFCY